MNTSEIDALAARLAPVVKNLIAERDLKIATLTEQVRALERQAFEGAPASGGGVAKALRQEIEALRAEMRGRSGLAMDEAKGARSLALGLPAANDGNAAAPVHVRNKPRIRRRAVAVPRVA